jgi:signal transduction histidine kinase
MDRESSGGSFASAAPEGEHQSLRDYEEQALIRTFGFAARLRLALLPALVFPAFVLTLLDPAPWRRVAVGTLAVVVVAVAVLEYLGFRRRGVRRYTVPFNAVFAVTAQLLLVGATGGLASPFVPSVLVMAAVWAVLGRPRQVLGVVLGLQLPGLWLLASVQALELVPGLVPAFLRGYATGTAGPGVWVVAASYTLLLGVAVGFGMRVRRILMGIFKKTVDERDQALRLYEEQATTLGSLSSEIGHELKNPLASIKGLSALVARGTTGKTAERVSMLRREVDRMQTTLEEFLNFSRPLVPLAQEPVELDCFVYEIAELLEGLAVERGVRLAVARRAALAVRCDPRKVRQIIVNLLKNAIEATPPGHAVELRIEEAGSHACVLVLDEGPGISSKLGERVFDAGVTSKAEGSGIGLPIARSLARQHGGELTLEPRPRGGTVARLRLPTDGAATHSAPSDLSLPAEAS